MRLFTILMTLNWTISYCEVVLIREFTLSLLISILAARLAGEKFILKKKIIKKIITENSTALETHLKEETTEFLTRPDYFLRIKENKYIFFTPIMYYKDQKIKNDYRLL